MRVLIAEDVLELAEALKKILEKERYAVDLVFNSERSVRRPGGRTGRRGRRLSA